MVVGAQRGDPLGPLVFRLAIHKLITELKSLINVWHLDAGIIGGAPEDVYQDFLLPQLRELGLEIFHVTMGLTSSTISAALQLAQIPIALLTYLGLDGVHWPAQTKLTNNSVHDFIIIGLGTAGSVVARRLAENKSNSVLALEYGGNPPVTALLAGLFVTLPHSIADYDYKSTFDPYAAKAQNNYTMLTAGKTIGGSATINHFIHTRGSPSDFDSWAEIANDDSWKYENILKYFIKSERVDDKEILDKYAIYHGTDGPMGLTRQKYDNELKDYFKAAEQAGNPVVLDVNSDHHVGYTYPQYMLADRKRQTPAYSYLNKIINYPNFHVSKNTRVVRIIFKNKVAVAVQAMYQGKLYTLRVRKEIILCAGVYNTPQILMLSGVGHEHHLKSMKIPVQADMPVGDNLIDQVSITVVYKTKQYRLPLPDLTKTETDLTRISFPVLIGSVALNKSEVMNPDYQTFNLLLAHDTPLLTLACHPVFGYRDDICDKWHDQSRSRDSLYNIIVHLQPKSRGTIRLKSNDPFDDPEINTGRFTDEQDIDDMVQYIKDFIKIGESRSFKNMSAEIIGLDMPECAHENQGSDQFWKCYVLNRAISVFHASSTCPMGTIVDGELKLKGFKKIRIIDASVMPYIPRSAPNAATIMLAEKGADMIINQE